MEISVLAMQQQESLVQVLGFAFCVNHKAECLSKSRVHFLFSVKFIFANLNMCTSL